jgi:hypothetical protein
MPAASSFSADEICDRWANDVRALIAELISAPPPMLRCDDIDKWTKQYKAWYDEHVVPRLKKEISE